MSEKFFDSIKRNDNLDRWSEDELKLGEIHNEALVLIRSFLSSTIDGIAKLNIKSKHFEHIHEGFGGIRYLDNVLFFHPTYPEPLKVDAPYKIVVVFNNKVIDTFRIDNDRYKSVNSGKVLSNELLESYLDYFVNED